MTIDRALLFRYVDDMLGPEERRRVEDELRKDPELRAELADLLLLRAAPSPPAPKAAMPAEPPADSRARHPSTPLPFSRASASDRFHAIWAVSVLALLAVGTTWWGLTADKERRSPPPPPPSPKQVLAGLPESIDKAALSQAIDQILDPTTTAHERHDLYRSWCRLDRRALEPLVWAVAPLEPDAKARAVLYMVLPDREGVADYDALLAAARREWAQRAIEPLGMLVRCLRYHPEARTESLFVELLKARPTVPAPWFGERLPAMQAAFPQDGPVSSLVVDAMKDEDEVVRACAGLARAAVGKEDGLDCARMLLRSPSADARKIAVVTIDRHGREVDIKRLADLTGDPDKTVKTIARRALERRQIKIAQDP